MTLRDGDDDDDTSSGGVVTAMVLIHSLPHPRRLILLALSGARFEVQISSIEDVYASAAPRRQGAAGRGRGRGEEVEVEVALTLPEGTTSAEASRWTLWMVAGWR